MREKDIERKLVEGVKRLGGRAYKWVSPGNNGVPDRIVVLPYGDVRFVELKTKTGRLSEIQKRQIERLEDCGCKVHVLYGEDDVKDFLEDCEARSAMQKSIADAFGLVYCKRDYREGGDAK